MTREEFERVKQRMKEDLPKLKSDYQKLTDIITMLDEFLEKGTPEKMEYYSRQVDNIVESMEILDL